MMDPRDRKPVTSFAVHHEIRHSSETHFAPTRFDRRAPYDAAHPREIAGCVVARSASTSARIVMSAKITG